MWKMILLSFNSTIAIIFKYLIFCCWDRNDWIDLYLFELDLGSTISWSYMSDPNET